MTDQRNDKALPPAIDPLVSAGKGNNNHDIDDESSRRSDHTGSVESSAMSGLSEKYKGLQISSSSGSFHPPVDYIKSSSKNIGASEEYEDGNAKMIEKLMENHGQAVSLSLVERSSLIKSIVRLCQHVPGCVISSLLDDINYDRERRAERWRQRGGKDKGSQHHTNKKSPRRSRRELSQTCDTCDEEKVYDGDHFTSPKSNVSTAQPDVGIEKALPLSGKRRSALLFVDISGFTKLSTMLDVDSFSNCINTYFQKVINQVASYGGDILKFAGDAIFCEWRVQSHESFRTLEDCVLQATICAADIVALCSDFDLLGNTGMSRRRSSIISSSFRTAARKTTDADDTAENDNNDGPPQPNFALLEGRRPSIPPHLQGRRPSAPPKFDASVPPQRRSSEGRRPSFRRRVSFEAPFNRSPSVQSTLNVKCGLGVGHMAGMHVGDSAIRREFLMLGDPIDQVAAAEAAASHGEVFASPEALAFLSKMGTIKGDWETCVNEGRPMLLASRGDRFFSPRDDFIPSRGIGLPCGGEKLLRHFDDFDSSELHWLKRMISLYVHPVVVDEERESSSQVKHETDYERNVAAAELRNVYTCFISPKVDYILTGDDEKDQKMFKRLNDIMVITTRHISRAQGHLRQFIVDDKGVVLIFTFGLRGSTFPNMIAQRAIPLTFTICQSLQDELGIKVAAGATFEKAYCGVVGGVNRHEFAVLGAAVNLAARLMSPKHNADIILVDKNVRLLTSQIFFRPLPAVNAKGYSDPVPIFQPMRTSTDQQTNKWGHAKKRFVGRSNEIKHIMHVAKGVALTRVTSKFLFVSASSGTGKSTLMVQATESVRAMVKKMKKSVIVTRYISNEGDSRIPFSLFRSIFKDLLRQIKHYDDESTSSREGSLSSSLRGEISSGRPVDFDIDKDWDGLSIQTHSTKSSIMSSDATRFRTVCEELDAPPEFVEIVGKRLLGLKSATGPAAAGKPPDLEKIVNFMADAFLRCTKHADLVLLALDDVHWMDEMSWKVVEAIFERSKNVLTFCGSRQLSTNSLAVGEQFWNKLHGEYKEEGRYSELELGPFNEIDVQEMIAYYLNIRVEAIDSSFWRNVYTSSGGMPHYLSYVLETVKRNNLTVELENGLIGLKSSESDESNFKSVNDLLLYRLDALDASVRSTLHLAAVLGTEFDLLDAALSYEEIFDVNISDRFQSAIELCAHFDVAEREGILEQVSSSVEHDQDEFGDLVDEDDHIHEDPAISSTGHKSHPLYSDNRRYRFTHDSWKTSILSVMLDGRKEEIHENIAIVLERKIGEESDRKDDLKMQINVFKHWNLSGNFTKTAELALKIGGELMILGLNTQADLLFSDVIMGLQSEEGGESYGDISSSVLDAVEPPELELLIKVYIAKGKALCNLARGKAGAAAYQSALDVSKHL